MRVVLTIKESCHGLWCICSGKAVLHDKLHFAHAIRLGRRLAREEYASSGDAASVEMVCSEFTIVLAQYAVASVPRRERAGSGRAWSRVPRRCQAVAAESGAIRQ